MKDWANKNEVSRALAVALSKRFDPVTVMDIMYDLSNEINEEKLRTKADICREFLNKVAFKHPNSDELIPMYDFILAEMENVGIERDGTKGTMNSEVDVEDRCVWKYEEQNQFYYKASSPHKNLDCMIDNSAKWKYCPYCGKEIEYNKSGCSTV